MDNEAAAAEAIQHLIARGYKLAARDQPWTAPEGQQETAEDLEAINYAWHHATDEQLAEAAPVVLVGRSLSEPGNETLT